MAPNYELVRYRPELKEKVIELQTHLWSPRRQLNIAYFEWKYERNPYLHEPLVCLAMHGREAIGMRGFHGVQWEGGIPTQRLSGLYADDMVVAPDHRKRGLASKIMAFAFDELAKQKFDYVFNLSAGPVTFRSSLSTGWRSAGWMHPMRWRSWQTAVRGGVNRMMTRLPAISRKLDDLGVLRDEQPLRSLTDKDLKRLGKVAKFSSAISITNEPRCEAMAELAGRIEKRGRIRHVRSSEYFEWRFQNPLSRYVFIYWDEDRLEGYLVLQEYTSEFFDRGLVNIVDWEASDEMIKARLLQSVLTIAQGKRAVIWSATLPTAAIELLERNGFGPLPPPIGAGPPALLVRPIRQEMLNGTWMLAGLPLLDLASWDLPMLSSMLG